MALQNKVFRVSPQAKASLYLENDAATLAGDSRHFVRADKTGVSIKGPISIIADSMSIRKGGLFVGLNDFVEMIPSTIVSPIPKQIPFPPIFAMVNLTKDMAFFMSMIA